MKKQIIKILETQLAQNSTRPIILTTEETKFIIGELKELSTCSCIEAAGEEIGWHYQRHCNKCKKYILG